MPEKTIAIYSPGDMGSGSLHLPDGGGGADGGAVGAQKLEEALRSGGGGGVGVGGGGE